MATTSLFRRFESLFILGVAIIYVIRRLIQEVYRLDRMVDEVKRIPGIASGVWHELSTYNYILNNNIPLIISVTFFLMGWYVFHQVAYPQLAQDIENKNAWLYTGLAIVLLLTSALSYYYLKLYVRFQYDSHEQIIGLKVYSLYRKRTVLADTVGLAIVVLSYELLVQFYVYLNQKITEANELYFRPISYLFAGGIGAFLLLFAFTFTAHLPQTLWHGPLRDILILLALVIQIYFLQAYCFTYILPNIRTGNVAALPTTITIFLFYGLFSTIILFAVSGLFYIGNIITFLLVSYVSALSIAFLRQALTREKTVLQTQVSSKSAELASLRAQINPHFLFNALNSLYATALKENSEKTADGIQKLGDMMRFMLQENNRDRIPLSKEITYLKNYIDLQRMRLDESHGIEIRVTIQEPDRDIYLAPMMLIPFVENAFKHGISLRNPSWIYITLTLDTTHLYFKVHNSLHIRQATDPEDGQSGVGLDNVRKRLELIYPGRHQLIIQQSDQDYFVSLTLGLW